MLRTVWETCVIALKLTAIWRGWHSVKEVPLPTIKLESRQVYFTKL